MFSFNRSYILLIVFLLLTQAVLDFFLPHTAVHPTMSNMLVAVMVYACLKTFWRATPVVAGFTALLLTSAMELLPQLQFADLEIFRNSFVMISTGNSFWATVMCYAAGIMLVLMTKRAMRQAAAPPFHNNLQ